VTYAPGVAPDRGDARLERERAFHDDASHHEARGGRTGRFYALSAGHRRYIERLRDVPRGAEVLEYGCGRAAVGGRLARRGVTVTGIDLSPASVERARNRIGPKQRGRLRFLEMNAEALDFPDDSFDVVCGSGILHHLDVERAYREVARVLRPDGYALFVEPLGHNPLINLYRRRTPELRSEDEHPLELADLDAARRWFGRVDTEHHDLTVLAAGAVRRSLPRLEAALHRVDDVLFRRLPASRRWSWTVVLRLGEPVDQAG
jgi:SAM-dependent methyltransferase